MPKRAKVFLVAEGALLLAGVSLALIANWRSPIHRAVVLMGTGLVLMWVFGFGALCLVWGEAFARRLKAIPIHWGVRFAASATIAAMLEEAITTSLTNAAPLMGVRVGDAYITASANYVDVIAFHSVVMFVPLFVAWATMLRFWRFTPLETSLLFGVTGTIAETSVGSVQALFEAPMWIAVYGLMVYLPALATPAHPKSTRPRFWAYPLAVLAPFLFEPIVPIVFVLRAMFSPHHPDLHFPPIH